MAVAACLTPSNIAIVEISLSLSLFFFFLHFAFCITGCELESSLFAQVGQELCVLFLIEVQAT